MYLKRLEIQGFKSFARKTVMEFEPGVTSVVGPNGSGKSNVADSIRWVLGEQSQKLIRGKKSDDVIFAGSDKKTRLGFAEVFATFDNSDRKIPLDVSEVSIGRRIYREGDTEYLINGTRVRLADVVELVLKSNIGTSRYTVIGQGTIDQLILAGPVEIKSLLDEASGVKTYYIKREKALRRIEQTVTNLLRSEDTLAELEPRLKSLRRLAKRMEAREVVEKELRAIQRIWFASVLQSLDAKILSCDLRVAESQKSVLEVQAELASKEGEMVLQDKNFEKSLSELSQFRTELSELGVKRNQFVRELSFIQGKVASLNSGSATDPVSLKARLHELRSKFADFDSQIVNSESKIAVATSKSVEVNAELSNVNKELDVLYGKISKPKQVDWRVVENDLTRLDTSIKGYLGLVHRGDLDALRQETPVLLKVYSGFHGNLTEAIRSGSGDSGDAPLKLQEVLQLRERLAGMYNEAQSELIGEKNRLVFLKDQQNVLKLDIENVELELRKSSQEDNSAELFRELAVREQGIRENLNQIDLKIKETEGFAVNLQSQERWYATTRANLEKEIRALLVKIEHFKTEAQAVLLEKARFDTQRETLYEEIRSSLGEVITELAEIEDLEVPADAAEKITKLKGQLSLIGGVDEVTLKEYEEAEERFTVLSEQVKDLRAGLEDLKVVIEELDTHIKVKFNESFHKINAQFEQYFKVLFNGGKAQLVLVKEGGTEENGDTESGDENEVEQEAETVVRPEEKLLQKYEKSVNNIIGVNIKATPPGKKLASIQALSGGERALTSIALLCSLLTCFPSPFVFLDEVDAALDEANTVRFGEIIGSLAHQTQFITITHNRETMSQSNILYGVTMGDDGVSKLLSVKFAEATAFAK